jgi:hypothetical protein
MFGPWCVVYVCCMLCGVWCIVYIIEYTVYNIYYIIYSVCHLLLLHVGRAGLFLPPLPLSFERPCSISGLGLVIPLLGVIGCLLGSEIFNLRCSEYDVL